MELKEFIKDMEDTLLRFQSYWIEHNKIEGEKNYPMNIDGYDWDEQFEAFNELEEIKGIK